MKKITYLLTVFFLTLGSKSIAQDQNASVEEITGGVQLGVLGVWGYAEKKLADEVALRFDLGLDAGIFGNSVDGTGILIAPSVSLEPRWYYNLDRRLEKGRRIDANSGNFLSLKIQHISDIFTISTRDNIAFIPSLYIIPSYGLKRNIGSNINYEIGGGVGLARYFDTDEFNVVDKSDLIINLHLRIGGIFK